MKAFRTNKGCHIHILPITITVGTSADYKCIHFTSENVFDKSFVLEGDDYARWGSDDDYIKNWICDKEPYIGRPVPDVDASGNPIPYVAPATSQIFYDDTRSVHNDADIARIQTLQEQLDVQAGKLKTIMDLLYKNGSI